MNNKAGEDRRALRLEAEKARLAQENALAVERARARLALRLEVKKAKFTADLERAKAQTEVALEDLKHRNALALEGEMHDNACRVAFDVEMFRSVISYGQAALRGAFLINGAAAIATLSYLGSRTQEMGAPYIKSSLAPILMMFGWGALLAVAGTGVTYLAQMVYARVYHDQGRGRLRVGTALQSIAIIAAIVSMLLFLCGAYRASQVLG